jgi:ATP-dependent Clp protease ATP-binding subunit ClpX
LNGILLRFDKEAVDRIIEIALDEDGKGIGICSRLLKDYEHGMRLIRDKIGRREFLVSREAVDDPEGYLNRMIREIYSKQSDQGFEGKE